MIGSVNYFGRLLGLVNYQDGLREFLKVEGRPKQID